MSRRTTAIAAALSVLSLGSPLITGCTNPLATQYFNQGVEKYEAGNYQGAIADWSKAIEINPQDAYAYYNRGNAKYDLKDYVIVIIYRNKNEVKILSKINFRNSFKVNNQNYLNVNLDDEKDFNKILNDLKNIYEDEWKKNNEINTSIKLPLTVSVKSKDYKNIIKLEDAFSNIDLISNFYILNFDNKNTQYRIIYNGSPKTFLNDMNNRNFNLSIENNLWTIE